MNRDETIEAIKVMQHFVDSGAVGITARDGSVPQWGPISPGWNWVDYNYYIKPKLIECWAVVDQDGDGGKIFTSVDGAQAYATTLIRAGRFGPYRDGNCKPYRVVRLTEATS